MKVLVTGGGGFLGQYIVEQLLKKGEDVRVIGRGSYPELRKLGAETLSVDIRDKEAVTRAAKGTEAVFHVASKTGIWGKWQEFYDINVHGTENVIHACKKNGISILVYTSSPSVVYGSGNLEEIDETYPYPDKYLCPYPKSKAMAEKKVLEQEDLLKVSIRPHLIWGPRDTNLIPRLVGKSRSGRLVRVGDGKNKVDIVYVENAADSHILAFEALKQGKKGVNGQAYFITQGEAVCLWDWIERLLEGLRLPKIKRSLSYKTAYNIGAGLEGFYKLFGLSNEPPMTRFLAAQLAKSHFYSTDKARKELGYQAKVSTAEGEKRLFEYYRSL